MDFLALMEKIKFWSAAILISTFFNFYCLKSKSTCFFSFWWVLPRALQFRFVSFCTRVCVIRKALNHWVILTSSQVGDLSSTKGDLAVCLKVLQLASLSDWILVMLHDLSIASWSFVESFFEGFKFLVERAVVDLKYFILDGLQAEFVYCLLKGQPQIALISNLIHIFIL